MLIYEYVQKEGRMTDNNIETCDEHTVHAEIVAKAKTTLLPDDLIYAMSDFYKVLGDPTRIKILQILFASEMCVCDLASVMSMNQPAISQQLKTLKAANLVKYRKDGKNVIYSISDDHVKLIFDQCLTHIKERF